MYFILTFFNEVWYKLGRLVLKLLIRGRFPGVFFVFTPENENVLLFSYVAVNICARRKLMRTLIDIRCSVAIFVLIPNTYIPTNTL